MSATFFGGDRFEGRFRDDARVADVSDLMRRMVKENLLKFEGTPPFPERIAHTIPIPALLGRSPSVPGRHRLCARKIQPRGDARQRPASRHRRLRADDPATPAGALTRETIYQSLRRHRERLENRLRELEVFRRSGRAAVTFAAAGPPLDPEGVRRPGGGTQERSRGSRGGNSRNKPESYILGNRRVSRWWRAPGPLCPRTLSSGSRISA